MQSSKINTQHQKTLIFHLFFLLAPDKNVGTRFSNRTSSSLHHFSSHQGTIQVLQYCAITYQGGGWMCNGQESNFHEGHGMQLLGFILLQKRMRVIAYGNQFTTCLKKDSNGEFPISKILCKMFQSFL